MQKTSISPSEQRSGWVGVWWISATLLVPGIVVHCLIEHIPGSVDLTSVDIPYGYTWSLLFYGVPVLAILCWIGSDSRLRSDGTIRQLIVAFAILIPIGVLMNFLFAGFFFAYPNRSTVIGWDVPVFRGLTPFEDYVFYFIAFPFVTLIYIWADRYWLARYHVKIDSSLRREKCMWWPIPIALILIGIAFGIKRHYLDHPEGFPGYFAYVLLAAVVPPACLLPKVRYQINWQAFGVTHILMILVCMEWEANIAIPFGFWAFQENMMIGIQLPIWHGLPIEQIMVWFVSAFTNVVIFEMVRRHYSLQK